VAIRRSVDQCGATLFVFRIDGPDDIVEPAKGRAPDAATYPVRAHTVVVLARERQ
jgi:hypothetical protein